MATRRRISRRRFLEGSGTALTAVAATPIAARTAGGGAGARAAHADRRHRQRHAAATRGRRSLDAGRSAPRSPRADRHQDRLRSRRVRRLHGPARRQAGLLVQPAGGLGRRPLGADGRRAGERPAAAGVRRARRAAVRLLHVGSVDEREGAAQRQPAGRTAEDARAAMAGNICRCASYNHYLAAIATAQRRSTQNAQSTHEQRKSSGSAGSAIAALNVVGMATPRIDAVERVTGKATYTGDVKLPGMLYARVLRSPHAHAKIRRIDARARSRCPASRRSSPTRTAASSGVPARSPAGRNTTRR